MLAQTIPQVSNSFFKSEIVNYWLDLRRSLEPKIRDSKRVLVPFGGPAISEPLHIYNPKVIFIADAAPHRDQTGNCGEFGFTARANYGFWPHIDIHKAGVLPLMEYEAEKIGATNFESKKLSNNMSLVTFNWRHPEESEAGLRRVIIYKAYLPSTNNSKTSILRRMIQLSGAGIFKGYMSADPYWILDEFSTAEKNFPFLVGRPDQTRNFPKKAQEVIPGNSAINPYGVELRLLKI